MTSSTCDFLKWAHSFKPNVCGEAKHFRVRQRQSSFWAGGQCVSGRATRPSGLPGKPGLLFVDVLSGYRRPSTCVAAVSSVRNCRELFGTSRPSALYSLPNGFISPANKSVSVIRCSVMSVTAWENLARYSDFALSCDIFADRLTGKPRMSCSSQGPVAVIVAGFDSGNPRISTEARRSYGQT